MTSRRVTTYSADAVDIIFLGVPIPGGYGDDFLTLEHDGDAYSTTVGADGEVAYARSNNHVVRVTVRLMQGSAGNTILSEIAAADRATPNGSGVGTFVVVDRSSLRTIVRETAARIVGLPNVSRSRDVGVYEWVIACPHATLDFGGAPTLSG